MSTPTISHTPQAPPGRKRTTRAQRLMLAIGIPVLLVLIGWGGLAIVTPLARGRQPVSVAIAGGGTTVRASLRDDADVNIVPGDSAYLKGTISYGLVPPRVGVHDGSVSYRCLSLFVSCSMNSTLSVPADETVMLSSGPGDLRVSGGSGRTLWLSTTSGAVIATAIAEQHARISSEAGDITATGITAQDVSVRASDGDITLSFTRAPHTLTVTDATGDVRISLPSGTAAYNIKATSKLSSVNISHAIRRDPSSARTITVSATAGYVQIDTF